MLIVRWQKSELHELSRRGKSEVRKEKRERIWRECVRDQRGVCVIHWLTRKALVITISILVVVWVSYYCPLWQSWLYSTGLILFFTIPRPPAYAFYVQQPFTVNNSTVSFARTPANFTFTGNLNVLGKPPCEPCWHFSRHVKLIPPSPNFRCWSSTISPHDEQTSCLGTSRKE